MVVPYASEPINSTEELRQCLANAGTSFQRRREGLLRFKDFLNQINQTDDDAERVKRWQILEDLCAPQAPRLPEDGAFPQQLISQWNEAVRSSDESTLSNIPSVLALFLKTISSYRELRICGLDLCQTLLSIDCLRLFDRSLTAPKALKEHLISPCLRLLTEIVSFDGGEVAKVLYLRRESTFRNLDIFLEQRTRANEPADGDKKPSLRRIALRYLLANLKYQGPNEKASFITQGSIVRRCLQHLRHDQHDIILDLLTVLERYVIKDSTLPQETKSHLFRAPNLSLLAGLYTLQQPDKPPVSGNVRARVDSLLRMICTQSDVGILVPGNGWHYSTAEPESAEVAQEYRKEADREDQPKIVPANSVLSSFAQHLRPDSDSLQASLLLDIFRAAPELVADYFSKKSNFLAEPKDTPQWLGQAAFIFSVIQLPVPEYCGRKDGFGSTPPPTHIVIENICPRPLDRSSTTRCLNLNHEVITLFAVRAMTVSFQKLHNVLEAYRTASMKSEHWPEASSRLLRAFSQRCPLSKDILSALQRIPKSDTVLHAAIIELLALYYQLLPHLLLREKFDASLYIVRVVERLKPSAEDPSSQSTALSELRNLLKIAQISSDARWWQKPDQLDYSAFTSVLKAVIDADSSTDSIVPIKALLAGVLEEHGILSSGKSYFDALVKSLSAHNGWSPARETISFFDNCIVRISRQPVHYQDLSVAVAGDSAALPLLLFSVAEQWPYRADNISFDHRENTGEWIIHLLELFQHAGLDQALVLELKSKILDSISDSDLRSKINQACETGRGQDLEARGPQTVEEPPVSMDITSETAVLDSSSNLRRIFGPVTKPSKTTGQTRQFKQSNIAETLQHDSFKLLCEGLSSPEEEERRQAFLNLQSIMHHAEPSNSTDTRHIYLLVGELMETTKGIGIGRALPSILCAFAIEAADVMSQPANSMFGKVNKYLQRGPTWDASNFLRYWIERILLREPEDDHAQSHETSWLLKLLNRGLLNGEDMELYRKSNVFERTLALYSSDLCLEAHRSQISELIYRSLSVEGGMTLITRLGIESWFASEANGDQRTSELVPELAKMAHETTDVEAVERWKFPVVAECKRCSEVSS